MKRNPQTTFEACGIFRARLLDFITELRKVFTLKDFVAMFILALFLGGIVEYARAEIYKCTGPNGNLIFSQKPCGADAQEVVVKNTTAGVSITGDGDFSRVEAENRTRDIDRAIDRHQRVISGLQQERDAKLAELRRKQSLANNNLAGATYLQSIATEMAAVSDNYNARINAERDAVQNLHAQR